MIATSKAANSPFAQAKTEFGLKPMYFVNEDLASVPVSGIPEEFRKLSRYVPVIVLVPKLRFIMRRPRKCRDPISRSLASSIPAAGKFDQYKRDIPYSTLVQAFQSLARPLLGKTEAEFASWRHALLEALGPNGRLMVDLIPDLKLIIGEQPPIPELPPQQAQSRFQVVFRQFIAVFARPEHPLALFLDDLQWLDTATLDLLEDLLTQPDVRHLMLIGAYRDNEVSSAHPLMRKLAAIRKGGAIVHEIVLAPLAREDLGRLIADSLHCEPERATPLAQLVNEKTAGNPFFVIQFLSALAEEGLLTFDHGDARWSWDLNRIHAKGYTDNVVDLMVGKLTRLPPKTYEALQHLACLGNLAEIKMLTIVLQASEEQVHAVFWAAVRHGMIERLAGAYRFVHDRIQEAAYSLIAKPLRAEIHLLIGRLLVAQTPPGNLEEAIFEIVNQLNRGAALITSPTEREELAELNLTAGKRAKASTAYASALTYLVAGAALLARRLGAPARAHLCAGAEPSRMRVPDGRVDGRGAAPGGAFSPRQRCDRKSDRRVLARRSVRDPRSERPRGRGRSRIPPASGHRVVAASDGRGSTPRIPAHLVNPRRPLDRGTRRAAFDERPDIPRHSGSSDQTRGACLVYGCEPTFPGHLSGSQSQPRGRQL